MYIEPVARYYDRYGSQHTAKGLFLILIQPEDDTACKEPIKALVRKVALRQVGHFMMGVARIYGQSISISGAYGGDGLPRSVPREIYDRAKVVLPDYLRDLWNNGGGWNGAGSEAPEMKKWALQNLEALRK